jgi:uncharacterized membrane protein YuzA (DUF378 family)
MVTFILLVVGGLNWLLVGAFDFNLVTTIFGDSVITKVVYILVGLSALVEVLNHKKNCAVCK